MQDWLLDEYGLYCCRSTVYAYLQRAKWSRKVVSKHAAEQSQVLRDAWQRDTRLWRADQIVAIDESAANERTGDRKRGWAPSGRAAVAPYSAIRTERWSILPALTVDGYLAYDIEQGSFTQELVDNFICDQVLPHCNRWPNPRSILIMDNASIHKSERLQQICEDQGVLLYFIPSYSPDFNPIEQSFRALKSWIRKHYWMQETFQTFGQFLMYAIGQCGSSDARGYFHRSGYSN